MEEGLFLAEGHKCVKDLLDNGAEAQWIFYNDPKPDYLPEKISFSVDERDLKKLSLQSTPSGIIGVFKQKTYLPDNPIFAQGPRLYLDGLQDPGNLGTIIRSAHWFGIQSVLLSPDCVEWYNPKTVQSTMGSLLSIPYLYCRPEELKQLKNNSRLICADMDGTDIRKFNAESNDIIVIGNESKGVSQTLKEMADLSVHIPAANHNNKPESLNAAITVAIFLFKQMKSL